jgi:hypothetical protein
MNKLLYRTSDDVDIRICPEGGYALTSMEAGEWLNYTVYVSTTGNYDIKVRYAASNSNGKIKVLFGGVDKQVRFLCYQREV